MTVARDCLSCGLPRDGAPDTSCRQVDVHHWTLYQLHQVAFLAHVAQENVPRSEAVMEAIYALAPSVLDVETLDEIIQRHRHAVTKAE